VQLPGEGDPEAAKRVIQAGGQLELRLVQDPRTYSSQTEALSSTAEFCRQARSCCRKIRVDAQHRRRRRAARVGIWWNARAIVTGRDLRNATENRSTNNPTQWQVNFVLSGEAARRFGPFTDANKGRQLAIVLEHKVYSAPVINGRIDDNGMIEGNFRAGIRARACAGVASRSTAASIKYLEERTVGPSLGADSIRHGVQASVVEPVCGDALHVVLYKLSGANAVVALVLNLLSCSRHWPISERC
jgi:preprotein translocase subunit SecD